MAAPIDTLPPELLIEIFVLCSWNDPLAPTILPLVCGVWKDVVHSSPRIWQFISLVDDTGRSISSLQRQASQWITRSSPMPFDVDIALKSHTQEMILPLLSAITPGWRRWRTCSFLSGNHKEVLDVAELFCESQSQELETGGGVDHIEITINETLGMSEEDEDEESGGERQQWPSFERHLTGSVVLNVPLPFLPPPQLINSMGLTSLTVAETATEVTQAGLPDPVGLLNLLTAFPQLESLAYNGLPHEVDTGDVVLPVVTLPCLQRLTLRSTCSARILLSQLNVPMLNVLHLEHLNVDFQLHHFPELEEGDSEDEAHDFSQSPWSDRALGMGLRRLHRRCHPPLQTLIMNYADLRTKDFLYCFERFPLREFHIVGSDMSDKVVRMLKPYGNPEGVLHILLPQLVNLKLYHCHRLSGDALVDAMSTRVRFIDDAVHLPSMENVAVVGCSDVVHMHILALKQVLRSRFHASDKP